MLFGMIVGLLKKGSKEYPKVTFVDSHSKKNLISVQFLGSEILVTGCSADGSPVTVKGRLSV